MLKYLQRSWTSVSTRERIFGGAMPFRQRHKSCLASTYSDFVTDTDMTIPPLAAIVDWKRQLLTTSLIKRSHLELVAQIRQIHALAPALIHCSRSENCLVIRLADTAICGFSFSSSDSNAPPSTSFLFHLHPNNTPSPPPASMSSTGAAPNVMSRKAKRKMVTLKLNPPKSDPSSPTLDGRYIDAQKESTKSLWSLIKTANSLHERLLGKQLHNSLFCNDEATRYSIAEVDDKLQCYCQEVADCFQRFGPRADFHLGGARKSMVIITLSHPKFAQLTDGIGGEPVAWTDDTHNLGRASGGSQGCRWGIMGKSVQSMSAYTSAWILISVLIFDDLYQEHYPFHGTDIHLTQRMAEFYSNVPYYPPRNISMLLIWCHSSKQFYKTMSNVQQWKQLKLSKNNWSAKKPLTTRSANEKCRPIAM